MVLSYVIVGGGVAAVSCAEELRNVDEDARITLVSASEVIKMVANCVRVGQLTEMFDVAERAASSVLDGLNIDFVKGFVTGWDWENKVLLFNDGRTLRYDKLCIATGGRPIVRISHPRALTIRDRETIQCLRSKMKEARRVLVIGNGGIATEIVYELKNVEIIWAIRHKSISATFFDEAAAEFFKPMLLYGKATSSGEKAKPISKRFRITVDNVDDNNKGIAGCALGPDWATDVDISGQFKKRSVHVIYEVEMKRIHSTRDNTKRNRQPDGLADGEWPLFVELSNDQLIGCDLLIDATGVRPNADIWANNCLQLKLADDGGILVDDHMETSVSGVYACGDVCTAGWDWAKHWMQMRLWTQARQMGAYCGRAMALPDISLDFCFEMFTHMTTFFGFKVLLLGRFNAVGVEKPWHALVRITKNEEYVKLIVKDGRIQGAVLVGETDLDETVENLILNQIDISDQEDGILDPDIEIADYYD